MTIIMLLLLAVIILLLIAVLILWQRRVGQQYDSIQELKEQLTELEGTLKEIKTRQSEFLQTWVDMRIVDMRIEEREAATAQRAEQAAGGYKEEDAEQNSKEQLREESGLETGTKSRQENTTEMESDLEFELPAGDGQNEVGGNSEGRSRVPTSSYNIGKSGKMYTEEELELLIKE